jgi:hypothetical protein
VIKIIISYWLSPRMPRSSLFAMTDHPKDDHDHHSSCVASSVRQSSWKGSVSVTDSNEECVFPIPCRVSRAARTLLRLDTRPRWSSNFAIPLSVLAQTYAVPPRIYARIVSFWSTCMKDLHPTARSSPSGCTPGKPLAKLKKKKKRC